VFVVAAAADGGELTTVEDAEIRGLVDLDGPTTHTQNTPPTIPLTIHLSTLHFI